MRYLCNNLLKSKFFILITISFFLSFALPFVAWAQGQGVKGVQFEKADIDISENCNLVILKSSLNNGTFYVTPQPYIAVDKAGNKLFSIVNYQSENGLSSPHLEFRVFFTGQRVGAEGYTRYERTCDLEAIKERYNRTRALSDQIQAFDYLPIYKAQISIPNLGEQVYTLGDDNSNFLDIIEKDVKVRFDLQDKRRASNFRKEVNGGMGVDIKVDYFFSASHQIGRIQASFSKADFLMNLQNQIDLETPIKATKLNAQLKNKMRLALQNTSVTMNIDGGENDTFLNKVADSLFTTLQNNLFKESSSSNSNSNNGNIDQSKDKDKDKDKDENDNEESSALVKLNLKTLIETSFQFDTININISKNSDLNERKVTTILKFQDKIEQDGVKKLSLASSSENGQANNKQGKHYELFLPTGKEVTFIFNGKSFEALRTSYETNYYTLNDLRYNQDIRYHLQGDIKTYLNKLKEMEQGDFDKLSPNPNKKIAKANRSKFWFDSHYYIWGEEKLQVNYVAIKDQQTPNNIRDASKQKLVSIQKDLQKIQDMIIAAKQKGELLDPYEQMVEEFFADYNVSFNFPDHVSSFNSKGFRLVDFVLKRVQGIDYGIDYTRGTLTIRYYGKSADEDLKIVINNEDSYKSKKFTNSKIFRKTMVGVNVINWGHKEKAISYLAQDQETLQLKRSIIHLTTVERDAPELKKVNLLLDSSPQSANKSLPQKAQKEEQKETQKKAQAKTQLKTEEDTDSDQGESEPESESEWIISEPVGSN